jgi:hypothetical protein
MPEVGVGALTGLMDLAVRAGTRRRGDAVERVLRPNVVQAVGMLGSRPVANGCGAKT